MPQPPILSYVRFEILQTRARVQYLPTNIPDPKLPDHIKASLEEEWWAILDDTFRKIYERRFICKECGEMHDVTGVKQGLEDVKAQMERWDVEEICVEKMEEWEGVLEGIEMSYWEGVAKDHEPEEEEEEEVSEDETEQEPDEDIEEGGNGGDRVAYKNTEAVGTGIGRTGGISALLAEIERQ